MLPSLRALGLVDLLESDPRPAFVVALPSSFETPSQAAVAYSNPAMSHNSFLLDMLLSLPDEKHALFWNWIIGEDSTPRYSFSYDSSLWTKSNLQGKWVVMSRNEHHVTCPELPDLGLDASADGVRGVKDHKLPSPLVGPDTNGDYGPNKKTAVTRVPVGPCLSVPDLKADREPYLDVLESVDWSQTPLGPMDQWPPLLQQTSSQILCNSQPSAIYWGDKFTTVYNEAFSKLVGSHHPHLLGKPMDHVFPQMAPQIKKLMDISIKKQRASNQDETHFFVETDDGPPRETFLKWSIVPLIQNNECLGFIHPIAETTLYQMFRRRIKMLVNMGEVLGTAKDVNSYWSKLIEELDACEPSYDIPLAILYSLEKDSDVNRRENIKYACDRLCRLEGALGVPEGHPITPKEMRLSDTEDALAVQFRRALRNKKPLLIGTDDGSLPEHLLRGIQWRGFGDPCNVAIILPIRPTKEEEEMGLLVLGLNPRRPYDDAYKLYIRLLNQKLTTSLACTVLLEEERRRGRNAAEQAAYDQAMLKEKLAYQTKETLEYTRLFQVVSEFIPNGFAIGDHQGNITFANSLWYRITGYPDGPLSTGGFLACVRETDRHKIRQAYQELKFTDEVEFDFCVPTNSWSEARGLKSPFDKHGIDFGSLHDDTERYVMAQAKAERAGDGTIIRTFTCLTDVTGHQRTADAAMRRAQEAENLKRMAELATVGMFDMNMSGRLLGANNVFFEMCGIDKVNPLEVDIRPWATSVVDEDLQILHESLARLSREAKPQVAEMRLKTTWIAQDTAGNHITAPRWVNATFMPVCNSLGIVQSCTGCLSDVSLPKWQLELETERKEEAIESKRQQDNFIDMTSHEMRNPLSAIIHCSDAIIASMAMAQELINRQGPKPVAYGEADGGSNVDLSHFITNSIENAETIVACAQHQKRIVDDILTMSKLDSKLLTVTPCTVNPVQIGQEALKMFDVEARRVDIDLNMTVHKSFTDLGHEYLVLDSSRVKQVLINLLTNALKFTKSGSTRNVSVLVKGSLERPTDESSSVTFITPSPNEDAENEQPMYEGRNNPVYLMFEVKDTGQGLTEEEKASLFNRFVQASSRTHLTYGGSGLGLFISRRLTELQKGAIGVSSSPGVGSTFAFFIEAYVPTDAARQEAEAAAAAVRACASEASPPPSTTTVTHKLRNVSDSARARQKAENRREPRMNGILIVEDNLINQQITRRGLHDRGFTVDVANHGIEALEKLAQSMKLQRQGQGQQQEQDQQTDAVRAKVTKAPMAVNIILMDLEMPVQDGLTCTRRIRQLEEEGQVVCASGGRIPIIAVSANARTEQIEQARQAGCDDVLVKPYRMPELVEKMQVVVRRLT